MFTKEDIRYLKDLYRKIFGKSANNSKEFANFVEGNPNSLRIKVEEEIIEVNEAIMCFIHFSEEGNYEIHKLIAKRDLLKELDLFITNYIENHYV